MQRGKTTKITLLARCYGYSKCKAAHHSWVEPPWARSSMGITAQAASFDASAPTLDEVVFAATRASGLSLRCQSLTASDLYRFRAEVAFDCHPAERVAIFAYEPEPLRAFYERVRELHRPSELTALMASEPRIKETYEALSTMIATGFGKPAIHTRGSVAEEGTLHAVLALALESLGGTLLFPISDARRDNCSRILTPALVRARQRRHRMTWLRELAKLPVHIARAASRRWFRRDA